MKKYSINLIILIIILTGCNSEKKYNDAISLLEQENWQEAKNLFHDLPDDYKDVSILKKYTLAKLIVQENKITEEDENYYTKALKYIEDIPNDYNGKYKDEIDTFSKDITEKQIELNQTINNKNIAELIGLVQNQQYTDALEKLSKINHKDVETMRNYILARIEHEKAFKAPANDLTNWNQHLLYMDKINPDYNGYLSVDINNFVSTIHGSWNELKDSIASLKEINAYYEANPEPEVGMTSEEVRNSIWGEPREINKTTTKYGVREQWVYYGNRYIYFEDGIVTTIQE